MATIKIDPQVLLGFRIAGAGGAVTSVKVGAKFGAKEGAKG
jgi:hypothetical protein